MAKGKKSKSSEASPTGESGAGWLRPLAIHGTIAALFIAGIGAACFYIKQYVEREVAIPAQPPTIVIKNKPHWMSEFLAQRIAAVARPSGQRSAFDRDALVQARQALASNPWVSTVYDVRRVYRDSPGDTIEIDCEYRAPAAIVKWGAFYWLVDRQGVKLPEQYEARDVPKIVTVDDGKIDIRIIDGVRHPPPESGKKWPGDDLPAALEMIALLADKPYAQEVIKVNVARFASQRDPHIVLITRYGTEVRWGRTPSESEKDPFIEVSTAAKLETLKKIYAQYGRVDAGQTGGIDIRFDKVTYPSEPPTESRTSAGE